MFDETLMIQVLNKLTEEYYIVLGGMNSWSAHNSGDLNKFTNNMFGSS